MSEIAPNDSLDATERRAILEAIARDESNYPRDRIAAVRELRDMDTVEAGPRRLTTSWSGF